MRGGSNKAPGAGGEKIQIQRKYFYIEESMQRTNFCVCITLLHARCVHGRKLCIHISLMCLSES